MFDISHFETLSEGDERLRYLKKCILTADHRRNTVEGLDLRYRYIQESVFNGDSFSAMIMFPEYMAMFSANTEKHSSLSFMTAFKWFIEEMTSYYQVTHKRAEEYFAKYEELLHAFGYSMRTYHMLRIKYFMRKDTSRIARHLKLYRECETDELSDCRACELDTEIQAELLTGSEEKAVRMLASLTQQNISCSEVPQKTYGKCVEHFTRIGDLDEADYYADLLLPLMGVDTNFLAEAGNILTLKSYTAPNSAYSLFCKYLDVFIRSKNPGMKFSFANGAAIFFENLNRDENELISMKLPRTFELYSDENQYDPDIMFDYFRDIASEIAAKFDKSLGNTYYSDILNYEYPSEPTKVLSLPEHGIIERLPFSVAVPFTDEDNVPTGEEMIKLLRKVPDIEFNDIQASDKGSVIICGYNSYIETGFICRINVCDPEDLDDYQSVHSDITKEDIDDLAENCTTTIVISTLFHKGTENPEMTALLQFADVLNTEHSPAIMCVTNGTLLSSKWVHFHAEGRLPLFDKYLYGVHLYPSIYDETKYDIMTTGLAQQACRELTVVGIDDEDVDFSACVLRQIADLICGFTELRDEGCTTGFGVVYNEESEVQFSWLPMEKAYPDNFTRSDNDLAVPLLYLSADDVDMKRGYLLNEVPEEARQKIDFRDSLKSLRIEAVLSQRNLPFAFDALERLKGSSLEIALTVRPGAVEIDMLEDDDEPTDEICILGMSYSADDFTVTGRVTIESELAPEYKTDNIVTLLISDIIFWRFQHNGIIYTPDDTYRLLP